MKAIFKRFTRTESKEEKKIVETSTPPSNPFPLADLPDLVILCIASKLKTNDARSLSFTCKRFKVIFLKQDLKDPALAGPALAGPGASPSGARGQP